MSGTSRCTCSLPASCASQIESGELAPGRPVPSLRTLSERYGVNRLTASKAIKVLADEGRVRRVTGRGWFVTPGDQRGQA